MESLVIASFFLFLFLKSNNAKKILKSTCDSFISVLINEKQYNAFYPLGNENTEVSFNFGWESATCPDMLQKLQEIEGKQVQTIVSCL